MKSFVVIISEKFAFRGGLNFWFLYRYHFREKRIKIQQKIAANIFVPTQLAVQYIPSLIDPITNGLFAYLVENTGISLTN